MYPAITFDAPIVRSINAQSKRKANRPTCDKGQAVYIITALCCWHHFSMSKFATTYTNCFSRPSF
jgi:hypothetical protein